MIRRSFPLLVSSSFRARSLFPPCSTHFCARPISSSVSTMAPELLPSMSISTPAPKAATQAPVYKPRYIDVKPCKAPRLWLYWLTFHL